MTLIQPGQKGNRFRDACWRIPTTYRFFGGILVATLIVLLFGASRFSAMFLVVKQPASAADFVFIADSGCGQCYRSAADRWKSGEFEGVLLNGEARKRLVAIGAIPPIEELGRQKLLKDGVAREAIQVLHDNGEGNWNVGRMLDEWLDSNQDRQVRVLCDLFSSRRWSYIFDRTIDRSRRSRVTVEGVTDPRYDETNWWRRRMGVKTYFNCLFQLVYARWHGEDLIPPVDWSPEKYESAVLESRR